jgi:hypothetical protein
MKIETWEKVREMCFRGAFSAELCAATGMVGNHWAYDIKRHLRSSGERLKLRCERSDQFVKYFLDPFAVTAPRMTDGARAVSAKGDTQPVSQDDAEYHRRVRASVRDLHNIKMDLAKKPELLALSTLTPDEAEAIVERQGYRCALTGLQFWSGTAGSHKPRRPSKDRINPEGPYTAKNVRIVLYGVNALRGSGTDAEMYEIAKALLDHRLRPEV